MPRAVSTCTAYLGVLVDRNQYAAIVERRRGVPGGRPSVGTRRAHLRLVDFISNPADITC